MPQGRCHANFHQPVQACELSLDAVHVAPILHRVLHSFHIEEGKGDDD